MKKLHAVCLASLAALGSAQSFAQNAGYFFGGVGAGQAQSKIDDERINATLIGAGAASTSISHDQKSTVYRIFGGYQFNPYVGLEAGYFNFGEFGFKSTTVPAGTLDGRIKLDGMSIDLVGTVPFNDQFYLLGRVGVHNARARDSFTSTGAVVVSNPNPEMRERNYKSGLGFAYQFNQSVTLRAEIERYRINDAVGNKGDINAASLSLVFPFGRTPAPAPKTTERVVYQEVPVVIVVAPPAPAPAPAPVAPVALPAVVSLPPERLRVSFDADVLFGFDRATVSPPGMRALDQFTTDMGELEYSHITIVGHTDRIGSVAYNEKLSLQRADAVKKYLESRGVPANKMTTVGKGSTEPALDRDVCKRTRGSAALIACLGPDRRVDVDVLGSKLAKK